jgi:hypothetical protein
VRLRAGENVTVHRYWMSRDAYQAVGPVQNLCFAAAMSVDHARAGQALSCLIVTAPELWTAVAEHSLTVRVSEADFELGGRRYGVYAKDWRRYPPAVYLERVLERSAGLPPIEEASAPPVVALSFLERGAGAALEDRIEALRTTLRTAASALCAAPRAEKLHRALAATYLVDAPPQEVVAERLGVPFSTYRYQLTRAVALVVERLWEHEIGAV